MRRRSYQATPLSFLEISKVYLLFRLDSGAQIVELTLPGGKPLFGCNSEVCMCITFLACVPKFLDFLSISFHVLDAAQNSMFFSPQQLLSCCEFPSVSFPSMPKRSGMQAARPSHASQLMRSVPHHPTPPHTCTHTHANTHTLTHLSTQSHTLTC